MLAAVLDEEERWLRVYCYIMIVLSISAGIYECHTIIKLRKSAKEVRVCYLITLDGNIHRPRKKALYIKNNEDSTCAIYNRGNRLLIDSIRYVGIEHIAINDKDTFDLLEYISPKGDTLLYDAYLNESIQPEHFEPHYNEPIYWEFNYQ